jgi:hypothetical protein
MATVMFCVWLVACDTGVEGDVGYRWGQLVWLESAQEWQDSWGCVTAACCSVVPVERCEAAGGCVTAACCSVVPVERCEAAGH